MNHDIPTPICFVCFCPPGRNVDLSHLLKLVATPGSVHFVLCGYDNRDLKAAKKGLSEASADIGSQHDVGELTGKLPVSSFIFSKDETEETLSGQFFAHIQKSVGGGRIGALGVTITVWLRVDDCPIGLYETIVDQWEKYCGTAPPPMIYSEINAKRVPLRESVSHNRPDHTVQWEDVEFRSSLLDQDETEEVKRATISGRSLLILGARGTGKSLLARHIHYHSAWTADGRFVERNVATIPDGVFDAEFAGTEKGYATGIDQRAGILEEADRGTLFLDEIAEISESSQAKLLRIVTEHWQPIRLNRLGKRRSETDDLYEASVRFIAATNRSGNEFADMIRLDLASRFSLRINLKRISDKRDENGRCASELYLREAASHFTALAWSGHPWDTPEWNWQDLAALHLEGAEQGRFPDNYRDLNNLIRRIHDTRIIKDTPSSVVIARVEILSALETIDGSKRIKHQNHTAKAEDLESLLMQIGKIDLDALTEHQIQSCIYQMRKTELELATRFAGNNRALAMRIYGMKNPNSFKKLLEDDAPLNPASPTKRRNARTPPRI